MKHSVTRTRHDSLQSIPNTSSIRFFSQVSHHLKNAGKCWQLYLVFLLPLIHLIIFRYLPMYGAQMAFRDFRPSLGITGSPWVGFRHFTRFFSSTVFSRVVWNTLSISLYQLIAGFPFPILLALSLNNIGRVGFRKTVQMITYFPHFISTVVMVGIIFQLLGPRFGLINSLLVMSGGTPINFMAQPELFRSIYVWSEVWQRAGYQSIIYFAALSAIDPELHEAATMDGANRLQRIWHIDLPGILPTIVVLFILTTGQVLDVGFEKIFLMQNPLNLQASEVIDTYVYKIGLLSPGINFSYAAAIGLFKSVVGLSLLLIVNRISRALTSNSLW